jgi:thiamine-phosphate pyrophosphorylase
MRSPRFYLISDRRRMGDDPVAAVRRLASAGLPAFQWREKDLPAGESLRIVGAMGNAIASERKDARSGPMSSANSMASADPAARLQRTRILVNDRCDIAAALGVGVHLPESGIPTRVARRILGPDPWIGRSTHSIESATRARDEGADFVTFGPIYDTPSKRAYGPPVGLDSLRAVARELAGFPVIALGGITIARVAECLDAGASGIAVIGAVWDAPDPIGAWLGFARALGIEPSAPRN